MTDTKLPPAIDLASRMNENTHSITRVDAVAAGKMLRRQHEAIVKLRYALTWIERVNAMDYEYRAVAKQALKDTEDLA